jgi:hypothetical protein
VVRSSPRFPLFDRASTPCHRLEFGIARAPDESGVAKAKENWRRMPLCAACAALVASFDRNTRCQVPPSVASIEPFGTFRRDPYGGDRAVFPRRETAAPFYIMGKTRRGADRRAIALVPRRASCACRESKCATFVQLPNVHVTSLLGSMEWRGT